MPIIRAHHSFDTHFTTIPNAWVRDPRISLKAKGLLVQLLSHTPGWSVSIGSLATANACGRDQIRSAVLELEKVGYLVRSQGRGEAGKFDSVLWITSDPTDITTGLSDKPLSGNPTADNPTTKKNKEQEEQDKEQSPQTSFEEEFLEFWKIYPRKVEKIEARKSFVRAYRKHGGEVLEGARRMAADPNLPPKQYVPYPASWLNAGGWTNEPYPERILSKQEQKAEDERRYAERRAREEEQRKRDEERRRREKEELDRELLANPVQRCIHDRVVYICPACPNPEDDTPKDSPHGSDGSTE